MWKFDFLFQFWSSKFRYRLQISNTHLDLNHGSSYRFVGTVRYGSVRVGTVFPYPYQKAVRVGTGFPYPYHLSVRVGTGFPYPYHLLVRVGTEFRTRTTRTVPTGTDGTDFFKNKTKIETLIFSHVSSDYTILYIKKAFWKITWLSYFCWNWNITRTNPYRTNIFWRITI